MQKPKIITIIGARPQFIKAAAISRAIRNHFADHVTEVIVHTGQHYDVNMSQVFFDELEIPSPDYNLGVGSGSHAYQAGEIMRRTEEVLLKEKPQLVVVYGDTNTTLAGALAASRLHIPVAHIEAGLRSYNKSMPEEINRVVCDHVSTLLFCPTRTAYDNLVREGLGADNAPPYSIDNPGIFHCGDVMYDNAMFYLDKAEKQSDIMRALDLDGKEFILCTIHRDLNTDDPARLNAIFSIINDLSREKAVHFIIPLHPRTAKMIPMLLEKKLEMEIRKSPYIKITGPISYFDTLLLESRCRMVMTDSGGVQKESYFFRKPCLVIRPETEWKELIDLGTAIIVDANPELASQSFDHFNSNPPLHFPPVFGDGHATEFILHELVNFLHTGLQE